VFFWIRSEDGKQLYRVNGVELIETQDVRRKKTLWSLQVLCDNQLRIVAQFEDEQEAINVMSDIAFLIERSRPDYPIVYRVYKIKKNKQAESCECAECVGWDR